MSHTVDRGLNIMVVNKEGIKVIDKVYDTYDSSSSLEEMLD